jgi:hypothetical protein
MVKTLALTGIIILTLNIGNSPLFAQSNQIKKDTTHAKLLYVVQGKSYLIPYIERKLKNLRRPDSDVLLYDSVASLNILAWTTSIEAKVIDILSETYPENFSPEFQGLRENSREKYSSFLQNFQSVLAIKDTSLEDLVEFQFILYDIVSKGEDLQYRNSSSIFIDPRSPHYQADINRALDQVFEEANKKPNFTLTGNMTKIGNTYFLTKEDTLLLQPIIDDESVEEDRIFFWTQDTSDKVQAPIELSKKNQSLKNLRPGTYHLHFRLSNGINYSRIESITVYVYTKPLLIISRPLDESFFRAFPDRLVIQEYIFSKREIDYFSEYYAKLDTTHFKRTRPDLWVKIYDKKGAIYALKSFAFDPPTYKTAKFNDDKNPIIDDIDNTQTPMKSVRGNKYMISFIAKDSAIESREVKNELNVYQRRAISILYDVMIFPSDDKAFFHSWINAGLGLDLRLNAWLSGIVIFGTDLAQASFQHFYTDLMVNFGPFRKLVQPFNKLEGGPALLINHDNGEESTGFKISYTLFSGNHTNLKFGASYYNQGTTDYFAINFTGDIFFNH